MCSTVKIKTNNFTEFEKEQQYRPKKALIDHQILG
jgi:hypothetical protein